MFRLLFKIISFTLMIKSAVGQSAYGLETKLGVYFENDALSPKGSDRHKTNGITLDYKSIKYNQKDQEVSALFNRRKNFDSTIYGISASQFIYTPEDFSKYEAIYNDRPYAGWMHATGTMAQRKGNSLIVYSVEIGMVGPAAYSDDLQREWHSLINKPAPRGWHNQLKNELGINLSYLMAHSFRRDGTIDTELITHLAGKAGNVDTHAEVGALVRIGLNVPNDMGMNIGGNKDKLSLYGLMKINQRLVLRNIFLDGNTFSKSQSVQKKFAVTTATVGVAARYKNFELGYNVDFSTDEFEGQNGIDQNGMLYFNFNKNF